MIKPLAVSEYPVLQDNAAIIGQVMGMQFSCWRKHQQILHQRIQRKLIITKSFHLCTKAEKKKIINSPLSLLYESVLNYEESDERKGC